jgi:hypothetical protein
VAAAEVTTYVEQFIGEVDEQGHRLVVRNGCHADAQVTDQFDRHAQSVTAQRTCGRTIR